MKTPYGGFMEEVVPPVVHILQDVDDALSLRAGSLDVKLQRLAVVVGCELMSVGPALG